jgi:hypothetical protein
MNAAYRIRLSSMRTRHKAIEYGCAYREVHSKPDDVRRPSIGREEKAWTSRKAIYPSGAITI